MNAKSNRKSFLDFARLRKTTYEFSERKVKSSDVRKILEAGRWAPSPINSQPWRFIVVRKKSKISRLVENAFYGYFHTAPSVIIALVLKKESWKGTHRGVKNGKLGLY
jgi:nitroreductase